MVRTYKRKPDARSYKSYTEEQLAEAVTAVASKEMTLRDASEKFKIPIGTLHNKLKNKHGGAPGHKTALTPAEELVFVGYLLTVANWGFPFSTQDVQHLIADYLTKSGQRINSFKNNTPSAEWVTKFVSRHNELSRRNCQNIKTSRAEKSREEISNFFDHFKVSLGINQDGQSQIPDTHVFNYDETNLSDDPGAKKCVFRKGVKYAERIMNTTKSSTSLMFCGSAGGTMLPIYVVYKAEHLWNTWTEGGPVNTRYNRSKSGWFDSTCFEDWFESCFIRHTRHLQGSKILIGDNLSSHFSRRVIELATENDIKFICLPSNSTHLMQPLDVAFFRPMKREWRSLLEEWKRSTDLSRTISKDAFPGLLKKLTDKLYGENSSNQNIKSGFRASGLVPFNPQQVLNKLPDHQHTSPNTPLNESQATAVSEAVLNTLKSMRGVSGDGQPAQKKRRTKVDVTPGKSISLEDISAGSSVSSSPHTHRNVDEPPVASTSSSSVDLAVPSTSTLAPSAAASSTARSTAKGKAKGTGEKIVKGKAKAQSTPIEVDSYKCLICEEPYIEPPIEDWIECEKCRNWCHEACAQFELNVGNHFYCDFCS